MGRAAPATADSSSGWDLPSFSATDDEDTLVSWEDDVGPVRVVGKQADSAPVHSEPNKDSIQDFDIPASSLIPKARPVNLDEEFPVLLEVEELGDDDIQPAAEPVSGDLFGRNSMDAADEVADAEAEVNDAEDPVHNDFISEGEYPDEDDLQNEVSEVRHKPLCSPLITHPPMRRNWQTVRSRIWCWKFTALPGMSWGSVAKIFFTCLTAAICVLARWIFSTASSRPMAVAIFSFLWRRVMSQVSSYRPPWRSSISAD